MKQEPEFRGRILTLTQVKKNISTCCSSLFMKMKKEANS